MPARVTDAMQFPAARSRSLVSTSSRSRCCPRTNSAPGRIPHAASIGALIDVRGCAGEDDNAWPAFGGFDSYMKIANVFAGDDEVVVEVPTDGNAALEWKPRRRLVYQHQRVPGIGHSKQYFTLQSAAAAPKFNSPAPRIRSTSRRTNWARVSSACARNCRWCCDPAAPRCRDATRALHGSVIHADRRSRCRTADRDRSSAPAHGPERPAPLRLQRSRRAWRIARDAPTN